MESENGCGATFEIKIANTNSKNKKNKRNELGKRSERLWEYHDTLIYEDKRIEEAREALTIKRDNLANYDNYKEATNYHNHWLQELDPEKEELIEELKDFNKSVKSLNEDIYELENYGVIFTHTVECSESNTFDLANIQLDESDLVEQDDADAINTKNIDIAYLQVFNEQYPEKFVTEVSCSHCSRVFEVKYPHNIIG